MKTTRYFEERVLNGRPDIQPEWCERVRLNPLEIEVQHDGRVRYWGVVPEMEGRVLRVVTLEDGETIHNAFFDRNYRKKLQRESEEL
uniref:hypothetical protein n=1 Tax=Trichocoleus desertorum TaxID=1481672 RepID=UPI0025B5D1B2|nr:hypothetical protein [Trichocoleus desertorum]